MFVDRNRTVTITATKVELAVNLKQGWNLVGFGENQLIPESAHSVYTWQNSYQEIANEYDILLKGIGYWIFSF